MRGWSRFAALALGMSALGVSLAAVPQPAAAQPAASVTRDFLLGRWTDDGDCSNAVDFRADGSFLTTDGAAGRWTLENGRLSFIGNATIVTRAERVDANTIRLHHEDGTVGGSTRCPAASRGLMPPLPATVAEALAMSRAALFNDLIGRWTDDGNCNAVITFNRDGGFTTPTGNGRWTLEGDRLTFTSASSRTARVRAVGADRIILIHPDGSLGQSVRC